jgi:hypothetical protein
MLLTVKAQTSTTITLGWVPPQGAEYYLFYAKGERVSNGPATTSNGSVRSSIKFDKSRAPFEVVCVKRLNGVMYVEVGKYPAPSGEQEYTHVAGLAAIRTSETGDLA